MLRKAILTRLKRAFWYGWLCVLHSLGICELMFDLLWLSPGSWCQVRAAMSASLLDSSIDTEGLQMAETALHIWFFSTFHLYPSFPAATQSFYSDEHCWFLWWWPPDIPRWCHSVGFSGMRERGVLLAQHTWWYVSAGSRVFKQLWQTAVMITAHVMI